MMKWLNLDIKDQIRSHSGENTINLQAKPHKLSPIYDILLKQKLNLKKNLGVKDLQKWLDSQEIDVKKNEE